MKFRNDFFLKRLAIFILMSGIFNAFSQQVKQPVDYVDPFIGTSNSRWELHPGPVMPFGMIQMAPDNQGNFWKGGYEYGISNIAGFSTIHNVTMEGLLVMPQVGHKIITPCAPDAPFTTWVYGYRNRFKKESEKASVGYYGVHLLDYDVKVELTSTMRTNVMRLTYPESEKSRLLFDLDIPSELDCKLLDGKITKVNGTEIEGYMHMLSSDDFKNFNEYTLYFVCRLSKPYKTFDGWAQEKDWRGFGFKENIDSISGKGQVGCLLNFETIKGEQVTLCTGISYISCAQARLNLETELAPLGWDFDIVQQNARNTWNALLSKIEVKGGTETDKIKFYTNLYRSYCGRATFSDVDGKYADMCENVQQVDPKWPLLGSDCFWNSFWNLNTLWNLVNPDISSQWIHSFLELYKRGGWLPDAGVGSEYWNVMVGAHEIALMASAYHAGIRDYDTLMLYESIKQVMSNNGIVHPCGGSAGILDLNLYDKYGYVPSDTGVVSHTLDYAFDDFVLSQLSKAMGHKEDFEKFSKRALNYRNVFNPEYKYVWKRKRDGSWEENFNPLCCIEQFVEGAPWQYSFYVPHDIQGVINIMGRDTFLKRLEHGFKESEKYSYYAPYDQMASFYINHGNQVNMQAAYLFNHCGAPWLTQYYVREIMDKYYGSDPYQGWLGDEDEGQMGAWYVISALGLFQMDGGTSAKPIYEIGVPAFDTATVHLDSKYYKGKTLTIIAENNSKENRYIQSATLNGKPLNKLWFYASEIKSGGTLVYKMGAQPNKSWGTGLNTQIPSFSSPK
jgi:predicted alpha-1,2-mannosidase